MNDSKDPLQSFRQPLVTAIALILGFSVGFLADWVTEVDFEVKDSADGILLGGMILSSIFLSLSLFGILKMDYPKDEAIKYYNQILLLFALGIGSLFFSLTLSFLV